MAAPSREAGPHARVLVVDDEAPIRNYLKEVLSGAGYAVETAEDHLTALRLVQRVRCDVALVDLVMPGISGLQTIDAFRAIHPDIEFIILTGHGTLENALDSLRKGVFDFLQKPVVPAGLLFTVARALERHELRERIGLYDLSRSIFSALDPGDLYPRVVASALQVLHADDASLMLLDRNRELVVAHSSSLGPKEASGVRELLGVGIADRVAPQPEPVIIHENVSDDERFAGAGTVRPVHSAIICPLIVGGELIGVLNVSRAVGREQFSEHDRRNATILTSLVALALDNARLHGELQARLQELKETREEAIQNEKMTALGGLLSGVAHELNNPLCGALGYAQTLLHGQIDAKVRKGIEGIVRESERASRIVANLLALARRERPEMRPLQINDVVLETLDRKASELKACRIETKVELGQDLPAVLGDFGQLQTALANLIRNARQSMFDSRGQGKLRVSSHRKGDRVVVTIADDGAGIPAENLRRVFDPFFTTREVGQGSGLGLSVCFAIVRDHGGVIRASSEPGRGSTFAIELPEAATNAVAAERPEAEAVAPRILSLRLP